MRKRKPVERRPVNAGISLPPQFIDEMRQAAEMEGFGTLTHLVRYLLTQWLQKTHDKWEVHEIKREQLKSPPEPPSPAARPAQEAPISQVRCEFSYELLRLFHKVFNRARGLCRHEFP